jgi:hypothetical protein
MALAICTLFASLLLACKDEISNSNGSSENKTAPKTTVALVFCDVTNSLTREENRKVGSLAADIVDKLPDKTIFRLYPIQIQTQLQAAIKIDINKNGKDDDEDHSVVEIISNTQRDEYEKVKQKRREQIENGVDDLYERLNKVPQDNRTCILNALGFAHNFFLPIYGDSSKYDLRMYLISDMIEECNTSPLPVRRVEMDRRNISREISLANTLPQSWNLSGVQIMCIFPTASGTAENQGTPDVSSARRPNRDDVKSFWNTVFKRCGFKDEDFQSGRILWIDSGELPDQLKSGSSR